MTDIVLCFSGGLDSTVLLYDLALGGSTVYPISVDYGQRHSRELLHALDLRPDTKVVNMPYDLFVGSTLTGSGEVPDGHYADESMRQTVVPNRNMVLLSLAGAYAVSIGASTVAYAAHSGDHAIYPDCRPGFIYSMKAALTIGAGLNLHTPFLGWAKAEIVELGHTLKVPFERTWSCYKGGEVHCGTCGTCYERKEAFQLAGVDDPTEYLA